MAINKNINYFIQMQKTLLQQTRDGGFYVNADDSWKWVECKIDEAIYKVEDGYKVTLVALDDRYGQRDFYQEDFKKLIEEGQIIPKTNETMHEEQVEFIEHIPGTIAYLYHYGSCVVGEEG